MQVLSTQYESLEALQLDVNLYKTEIEAHKLTVGVPAPLPISEIVETIVKEDHTIEWVEVEPSEGAGSLEWNEICVNLKEEYNEFIAMEEYQQLRKKSYPPIGDQLDALFHAGVFPEEMATAIQAVKDAYPKPPIFSID